MSDKFQTVTLTMQDGTKAHYTGRAQIDHTKPMPVTEIIVSEPKSLPDGMFFDDITKDFAEIDKERELRLHDVKWEDVR